MKILMVEDYDEIRHALERAFRFRDHEVQGTAYLDKALMYLPWCDAVLCDGEFPAKIGSAPALNWQAVLDEARKQHKGFVLFSGHIRACQAAHQQGVTVIEKGAAKAEDLLQALTESTKEAA